MSAKTNRPKDSINILEKGDVFFFYRPKVRQATAKKTAAKSLSAIQRFYLVLHPADQAQYRMLLVGAKRLPEIEKTHEKNWVLVDFVTSDKTQLLQALDERFYSTKTRGRKKLPAMRPSGEGSYCIFAKGDNTYFAYILELPKKTGAVQTALEIEPEAIYVISIKNPRQPGIKRGETVAYPAKLQKKFARRRFIPANPPQFLDYSGTELLLIGAGTRLSKDLTREIQPKTETLNSADIFKELKLWRDKHPLASLLEGKWV